MLTSLLQTFDDGRLTDSKGQTVDFSHTIIYMTSNLGNRELHTLRDQRQQERRTDLKVSPSARGSPKRALRRKRRCAACAGRSNTR